MKPSVALLATFLALGTGMDIFAQDHAASLPSSGAAYSSIGPGSTSKNTGAAQPSDNTPDNVDGDDTVVRLKTSDSLAAGAMSRDEGQITRKQRKREKVLEVDSTKKLQTSGTDGKFESSLLNSGLPSIDDVSAKPSQAAGAQGPGQGQVQEQGQAPAQGVTHSLRHKIFVIENKDDSKKNETAQANADSSPSSSPSPSPSASPDAAHR